MTTPRPAPANLEDYENGVIYPGENGTWWRCIKVGGWVSFVRVWEGEEGNEDEHNPVPLRPLA